MTVFNDLTSAAYFFNRRLLVADRISVTGGCGGLGLEAARSLLEHGCNGVALFDINPSASHSQVKLLIKDFPEAKIITKQVDVTEQTSVDIAMKDTRAELGDLNTLLCFAGIVGVEASLDTKFETFQKVIAINTSGSFLCAQAAAK
jgi:sorbose reductase